MPFAQTISVNSSLSKYQIFGLFLLWIVWTKTASRNRWCRDRTRN